MLLIGQGTEFTGLFHGRGNIQQTGAGTGFWQLQVTQFVNLRGLDATYIQAGDAVYFNSSDVSFKLPIIEVVSAVGNTAVVKVNNTGITTIPSVPNTSAIISRGTINFGMTPFTADMTEIDQQLQDEYIYSMLDSLINAASDGNGIYTGSGIVPLTSRQLQIYPDYTAFSVMGVCDVTDPQFIADINVLGSVDTTGWQSKTIDDFIADYSTVFVRKFSIETNEFLSIYYIDGLMMSANGQGLRSVFTNSDIAGANQMAFSLRDGTQNSGWSIPGSADDYVKVGSIEDTDRFLTIEMQSKDAGYGRSALYVNAEEGVGLVSQSADLATINNVFVNPAAAGLTANGVGAQVQLKIDDDAAAYFLDNNTAKRGLRYNADYSEGLKSCDTCLIDTRTAMEIADSLAALGGIYGGSGTVPDGTVADFGSEFSISSDEGGNYISQGFYEDTHPISPNGDGMYSIYYDSLSDNGIFTTLQGDGSDVFWKTEGNGVGGTANAQLNVTATDSDSQVGMAASKASINGAFTMSTATGIEGTVYRGIGTGFNAGIKYYADYSANYTDRSLVDKAYADSKRPYKVYTALLSQSGTSAPTATVLENTLGATVTWSRTTTGTYRGTASTGVFTLDKTAIFLTGTGASSDFSLRQYHIDLDMVHFFTSSGVELDTEDGKVVLEIRVYP